MDKFIAAKETYDKDYSYGEYCHEQSFLWGFQEGVEWVKKKLDEYKDPKTTRSDIKDLHKLLVQTCINFIKERNLTEIYEVSFGVDGLENDAIEFGEWTPGMDSSLSVIGLQKEDDDDFRVRKIIGESM